MLASPLGFGCCRTSASGLEHLLVLGHQRGKAKCHGEAWAEDEPPGGGASSPCFVLTAVLRPWGYREQLPWVQRENSEPAGSCLLLHHLLPLLPPSW